MKDSIRVRNACNWLGREEAVDGMKWVFFDNNGILDSDKILDNIRLELSDGCRLGPHPSMDA
jgi:hypothetical protein